MIGGATRGKGGSALGRHLADTKKHNDATFEGSNRGLVEQDIKSQIAELSDMASHSKSKKPLYHVHADPAKNWNKEQWGEYWQDFEKEFKLEKQPYAEVVHQKNGREHVHRVYSLVKSDGNLVRMDNDFARREKLNRLAELRTGEDITKGRHNKSVIEALKKEGKTEQAEALEASGITSGNKAKAKLTPVERAQQERTGIKKDVVARVVRDIYNEHKGNVFMFKDSLKNHGLILANGEKSPVVVDVSGNVHSLNRLINQQNKKDGINIPTMKSRDCFDFVKELNLSIYKEEKKELLKQPKIKKRFSSNEEINIDNNEENNHVEKSEIKTKSKLRFGQEKTTNSTNNSTQHSESFQRNTENDRQNFGYSRARRDDRRESTSSNFGRNPKQSDVDFRRNQKIEKELKRLNRDLFVLKQIKKYHEKIEKKQANDLLKEVSEQEALLKILDELFSRLFGTPTQNQLDVKNNLVKYGSQKINFQTLKHIVNNELKNVSYPKKLTEIKNISGSQKIKEETEIKNIYSKQKIFINDLNKKYNLNLPNPSFSEFLENHKDRNILCKEMLKSELYKDAVKKIDKEILKKMDIVKVPFDITDKKIICDDYINKSFQDYKNKEKLHTEALKEIGKIGKISFFDKIFNRSKLKELDVLKEKIEHLEKQKNDAHNEIGHVSRIAPDRAKSESERRLKANEEHGKDWKTKVNKLDIEALENLKNRLSGDDETLVNQINGKDFYDVLKAEKEALKIEKIRIEEEEKLKNLTHEAEQKTPAESLDFEPVSGSSFKR